MLISHSQDNTDVPKTPSQKMFSTLLQRALYTSSGTLVSRVAASLAGILIARAIGPGTFGVYAAVLALIELGFAFTQIGLVTGLKQEGSRQPQLISGLLGNVLLVQFGLGLVSLGVTFAVLPLVSNHPAAPAVFLPLALMSLSVHCTEPFLAVLQIRGEQHLASVYVGGRALVFLAGVVVLALFRSDLTAMAWCHGLSYFIVSLLIIVSVIARVPLKWQPPHLRTQLKGALPFGVSSALSSAFGNIPVLLLSHFGSPEGVGNFAVAFRFVTISILVGGVANAEVFVPALFGLFRADKERFTQICSHMQRFFVPAGILVSCGLYVCSEALVIVLQGEEYRDAIGLLRMLAWSVTLTYARIPADTALTTGDRMKIKILFQVLATGLVLFSSLLLIDRFGASGACVARLFGDTLILVLMLAYSSAKKLYAFSGSLSTWVPVAVTLLAALLVTESMSHRYLLAPLFFGAFSGVVWYFFIHRRLDRKEHA